MLEKKILIAEDERPLARALELKLTHEGFSVTVTANGQECIDKLKEDTYDILLVDLMMPMVDGFKVLEFIHTTIKDTPPPVIVLSNLSQPDDENKALELGAAKYFVKSNTPLAVIVDEVKKLIS